MNEKVAKGNSELSAYNKSVSNYRFMNQILALVCVVLTLALVATNIYYASTNYVVTPGGQAEMKRVFGADMEFAEYDAIQAVSKWAEYQLTFDKGSYEENLKSAKYYCSDEVYQKFRSLYYDEKDDGSKPFFTDWIENDMSVVLNEVANSSQVLEDGSVQVTMEFTQRFRRNSNHNIYKDYSLSVSFIVVPINKSSKNRLGYLLSENVTFNMNEG